MSLRNGQKASYRGADGSTQWCTYWRPASYSRRGLVLLLPSGSAGAIPLATVMGESREWIFTLEATSSDPAQRARDLNALMRHIEFRHDLRPTDLTVVAAGRDTLAALAYVTEYRPLLRSLTLIQPTLQARDEAAQQAVERALVAAPTLHVPTQVLLVDAMEIIEPGPTREFFDSIGGRPKRLSTLPYSPSPILAGVAPQVAMAEVQSFLEKLEAERRALAA